MRPPSCGTRESISLEWHRTFLEWEQNKTHWNVKIKTCAPPGGSNPWTVYASRSGWAALTDEIHQHIPLSSIVGWIGEKELDQTAIYRLLSLSCFHIRMEEVVATLNLSTRHTCNVKLVMMNANCCYLTETRESSTQDYWKKNGIAEIGAAPVCGLWRTRERIVLTLSQKKR